ncbi:MAG: CvpA family protein [Burkholderiaceae bacterium]
MASLDWILLAVLVASLLLGAWRGLIYEAVSVASWVLAFVLAQMWAAQMAAWLPMATASPMLRHAAGFVVVFVGVLFAGGFVGWLLKTLASRIGLRPMDRTLGAAFGLLRGVLILLAATVVVQATPLKLQEWWVESVGAGLLLVALRGLKDWLPAGWMTPWAA